MIQVIETTPRSISFGFPIRHQPRRSSLSGSVYICNDATVVRPSRTTAVLELPPRWMHVKATAVGSDLFAPDLTVHFAPQHEEPCSSADVERVASMLAEVKRLTGWSWERLAEALDRTRQAVHGWTLGRGIKQANLERLSRLHAFIRYIDRGSVEENGMLLRTEVSQGRIAADLVNEGRFNELREILKPGPEVSEISSFVQRADDAAGSEEHWFDRLARMPEEVPAIEFKYPPGEKRRVDVKRRS